MFQPKPPIDWEPIVFLSMVYLSTVFLALLSTIGIIPLTAFGIVISVFLTLLVYGLIIPFVNKWFD